MALAGAAKFWHDKYKSARSDGFIAAVVFIAVLEIIGGVAYRYIGAKHARTQENREQGQSSSQESR